MTAADLETPRRFTRRQAVKLAAAAGLVAAGGLAIPPLLKEKLQASVFVAKAADYGVDLGGIVRRGMAELGLTSREIAGKRVLLKPNLVEPHAGAGHINTHPLVVRAVAEAFLALGAASVVVAEGAGHRRDAYLVLEESGLADILAREKLPFFDLNNGPVAPVNNLGGFSKLGDLWLPELITRTDMVVSVAKMKTHHWAGVTLSMKNLFGVMPGVVYGWPKNVLHFAGIEPSILDINATVRPDFAIVDGIVGMDGDGPIMGDPAAAGVLVMGRSAVAVDATSCRIMGIDPGRVGYLRQADGRLGTIEAGRIEQRGESPAAVRRDFALLDYVPAQQGLRLGR
ncbi:DUF362 domain-containing protein [Desulfovibrio sp. TomC]|uniref:DUF362 domain-containing protein n=1 Tax=Desulfovibrio sp. TomC TaxID=1562888 RepID=UPI000573E8A2|nr:DUF362 domain-containing protein [Desulfovibrio sp. TomC]KHK03311.1 Iron-sulfur cluster-binding protein [Desulfovibrio sp. TomC]